MCVWDRRSLVQTLGVLMGGTWGARPPLDLDVRECRKLVRSERWLGFAGIRAASLISTLFNSLLTVQVVPWFGS